MDFVPQSKRMRHRQYGKASASAEEAAVRALEAKQERIYTKYFFEFVKECRSSSMVSEFVRLYGKRDFQGALRFTDALIADFSVQATERAFLAAGKWETKHFLDAITTAKVAKADPSVGVSFDVGDPATAQAIRQQSMSMIREITESQRELIRSMMGDALDQGMGYAEAGKLYRNNIGLTAHQSRAVQNYRRMLETNNSGALQRALRDRRFDRTIENAIRQNIQLSSNQIDRMVQRYQERYLAMRAETIARTEALEATNVSRYQAQKQLARTLDLDERRMERTWRCAMDGRQRDTHGAMNGQVRGMNEPFISPSGAKLLYPGDPRAPAAERINCRCVPLMRVKEPHEIQQQLIDEGVIAQMPKVVIPRTGLGTNSFTRNPKKGYHVPSTRVDPPRASGYSMDQFPKPTPSEMNDVYSRTSTASITEAINQAEKAALAEYAKKAKQVNTRLRTPEKTPGPKRESVDNTIKQMDSAVSKAKLSENVTTYRGAGAAKEFHAKFPDIKVGEYMVIDPGFMSATLSKDVALLANARSGVIYEILMPRGSRALPVDEITERIGEYEYLLDRGSRFVIRKITGNIVTLELLLS